ncbi:hypothetical protein ABVK25_002556, partial [Lepraria finkii]
MHIKVTTPSTGLPTRPRPIKPLSKEKWTLKIMAHFFDLVERAEIEGDEETSDILFELTNYEIDGSVKDR